MKSTSGYCAASFGCLMTNRPAWGINPSHWHRTLPGWPWGQLFDFDSTLCNDLHITEAKLNVRGYINIAVQLDWKCTKVRKWKNELPNDIHLPHCWLWFPISVYYRHKYIYSAIDVQRWDKCTEGSLVLLWQAAFISVFPKAAVSSLRSGVSCREKGVSRPWKPVTPSCY